LQSLGGERDPKPEFGKATPASGDAFLLCSDGLWEAVTPEEMGKALLGKSLSAMATSLVTTAARRRGARSDNVTAALIRVAAPIKTPRHYLFWITLIIAMSIAVMGAAALFVSILVNGWLWNPSTLDHATPEPGQLSTSPKSAPDDPTLTPDGSISPQMPATSRNNPQEQRRQ
jgi:hypothetical protein